MKKKKKVKLVSLKLQKDPLLINTANINLENILMRKLSYGKTVRVLKKKKVI